MLKTEPRRERGQLVLRGSRRRVLRQPTPHGDAALPLTREVGEDLAAVNEIGMLGDQGPEGGCVGAKAAESLRRDTHHPHGLPVQTDRGADHICCGLQLCSEPPRRSLPGASSAAVKSPRRGRQLGEEVSGHEVGPQLGFVGLVLNPRGGERENRGESAGVLSIEGDRGVGQVRPELLRPLPLEAKETVGVGDGQRAKHHHVEGRERRHRGADPDGQDQHRRGWNPSPPAPPPRPMEPQLGPSRAQRRSPGLAQSLRGHLAMALQLLREFFVHAPSVEEVVDTAEQFSHRGRLSSGAQDGLDGPGLAVVAFNLGLELLHPVAREFVEADLAIRFGNTPGGGDPALEKDLLQGRVKRPLFDPQRVRGEGVDSLGDGVSVERPGAEDAKDQEHQSARRHFVLWHRQGRHRLSGQNERQPGIESSEQPAGDPCPFCAYG